MWVLILRRGAYATFQKDDERATQRPHIRWLCLWIGSHVGCPSVSVAVADMDARNDVTVGCWGVLRIDGYQHAGIR